MAAAASIFLFFGIKYLNTGQEQLQWSSLAHDEISLWIENDIGNMSSLDIAEAYSEVELEATIPEETDLDEYLQQLDLETILDEQ